MGLSRSFNIPCDVGLHHDSLTPATSVAGLQQVTSSRWHHPVLFSPLPMQGLDPLSAEQAADIYQLATEGQALDSDLAKWFQTICGLKASHHTTAQATAHEMVLSGCLICSAAYAVAATTQQADEWESALCRLCEEANKAWKDVNDVIFSHLLKYNSELPNFLNSTEDALRNKCDEILRHIYSLVEAANCSPQAGLSLVLQTLNWVPSIPWDLSYRVGIPLMFAYGPELYELHSWGTAGDGDLLLDNHAWVTNLLSHKLACMHGGVGSNVPSPSRVASPTSSAAHHSPASSHPGTPSLGTNIVRSRSNSASSHGSQTAELKPPAGSGDEGGKDSKSICQDDSETNEEGGHDYGDEAPENGQCQDSEDTDTQSSKESSSDTEESSSQSTHSSSETNGEIQACMVSPAKETQGDTSVKGDKANDPKSLHPPSQPDNNKESEEEQKYQHCKEGWFLDKNFGACHAHTIGEGRAGWEKHDAMTCDHGDPYKELRHPDPAGPPLDFMKHHRVLKAKKSNKYDHCHFYHIELSRDLPTFPSPSEPATCEMLEDFLLKARALGHPNLIVAFAWDSSTAVCLLQEIHSKDSLRHLPMEPKPDVGGKATKKLSFCPFYLYNGSNNLSYINHIMCRHYHANYGCGQCRKEVFTMGQQLKNHLKICTGFPKANTPSLSEKEPMPQGSQETSQASPHHSQHPKKKKSDSAKKSSGESSLSKVHKKSKCH